MIDQIQIRATEEVAAATSVADLKAIEAKYLGKAGELSVLMKELGKLDPSERPAFGSKLNQAKASVQALIDSKLDNLSSSELEAKLAAEKIDVTLPGWRPRRGREHILQTTMNRIKDVFTGMGFTYIDTPELETFTNNFERLNYPPNHPAMDDQDTFYVDDTHLLRTQCTDIQGHVLFERNEKPPLRYFTVGRTYRNESVDRTHSHTFHQVDVFMIDKGIGMADLKGTLGLFARSMFGDDIKIRFRPDFFPFVEPGVDYAISTPKLFGGRWLELGGAGLIHPNILRNAGIDPQEYSGFAFGLGVERIPMIAHGIDDLRHFLENDLRFLEQFAG